MPIAFIWHSGASITCELKVDGKVIGQQFAVADFDVSKLSEWLRANGFRREEILLAPVLPEDLFLRRNIVVPNEALASLPQILDQEIVRRTPFLLSDVWHAAVPSPSDRNDGAIPLCQWIIRRDRARVALASIAVSLDEYDRLAARITTGEIISVVSLRDDVDAVPSWVPYVVKSLTAALVATSLLGLLVFEWCQVNAATDLETAVLEARAGVQGGKSGSSQLARIYAAKADGGFLAVWDELSRILPDDTFLTELRFGQGPVTIVGYSSQAAHLVRIVDQSSMFTGATLVSAIIPDINEGKDRFSITFRLRNASAIGASDPSRKADR